MQIPRSERILKSYSCRRKKLAHLVMQIYPYIYIYLEGEGVGGIVLILIPTPHPH
jgi:hypothetical protein